MRGVFLHDMNSGTLSAILIMNNDKSGITAIPWAQIGNQYIPSMYMIAQLWRNISEMKYHRKLSDKFVPFGLYCL
jgi:hypothetical protein